MSNLIIVSNRLPFRIERKGSFYEMRRTSGGLVSALQAVTPGDLRVSWLGIADFKKELWEKVSASAQHTNYKVEPLFVDKKLFHDYYNGFSNGLIWPLFHYFPSYAEYDRDAFAAYQEVNRQFAARVAELAQPGDLVWIHDYHLMLLPKLLKELRPDVRIGFFLHIPFPSYELFKLLPAGWRGEILDGITAADVIGFHTAEYAAHFQRCLSYFSRIRMRAPYIISVPHAPTLKAYPISIDYDQFSKAYSAPQVTRGRKLIRQRAEGAKIIFSVDRLDYTKGVINRLTAYEELLETRPEFRARVVFIINVVPSRDQITKYAERKKMIEEHIGRINGMYGNIHWQPVVYQYRHLSFTQLMSFYSAADVALVTPLRDGMNLVAKEFIAARQDKRGVLVLSEFAGAASELPEAILVNPNDIEALTQATIRALSLSDEEQASGMQSMQATIKNNNVNHWINNFLSDLKAKSMGNQTQPRIMTFEHKVELFTAYRKARKRLLLIDYDGTLVPFADTPELAIPRQEVKDLLKELQDQPENDVVVVSGRDSGTLEEWLADTGVALAAEHGAMFKTSGAWKPLVAEAADCLEKLASVLSPVAQRYPGTLVERKKYSIAIHYRRLAPASAEALIKEIAKAVAHLHGDEYTMLQGKMVIEFKAHATGKGTFAKRLLGSNHYDFVMAIGDDTTDEEMFSALTGKNHWTIRVGMNPTAARCNLININSAISLLDQLTKHRTVFPVKDDTSLSLN